MNYVHFDCERYLIEQVASRVSRNLLIDQYCGPNYSSYNMVYLYYKRFHENAILMCLVMAASFPFLFMCISHVAEKFLSSGMKDLSNRFRLSPTIAAVTLIALANGAPDLISAMSGKESIGRIVNSLGMFYGGFVFGVCPVVAKVISTVGAPIVLPKAQIIKENLFYLAGIGVVVLFALRQSTGVPFLITYFSLYVLYIGVTLLLDRWSKATPPAEAPLEMPETGPADDGVENGPAPPQQPRPSGVKPVRFLKSIFAEFAEEDATDVQNVVLIPLNAASMVTVAYLGNPLMKGAFRFLVLGIGTTFTLVVFEIMHPEPVAVALCAIFATLGFALFEILARPSNNLTLIIYEALSILAAVAWIKILAMFIVDFIAFLAFYFNINEVILSAILLSAGNGVADFFGNAALAKRGEAVMAAMASYSSQVFNSYVGFGLQMLRMNLLGLSSFDIFDLSFWTGPGEEDRHWEQSIGSIFMVFLMSFVVLIVLFNLVYMFCSGFTLRPGYAAVLYGAYAVFFGVSMLFVLKTSG